MTTKTTGVATQGVAAKHSTKPETSTTAITENGTTVKVENQIKVLSVEDRRGRAIVFNALLEKQAQLKDVKTRMEAFVVGSDENSQHIQLKDGTGKTFQTGKPEIIKPIIELVRKQLEQQVGVVESEILAFII